MKTTIVAISSGWFSPVRERIQLVQRGSELGRR